MANPNPFNPRTKLIYELEQAQQISIDIFDLRGHHVCNLFEGHQAVGRHEITWKGVDQNGRNLASGIYLAYMKTGQKTYPLQLTLVR